MLVLENHWLLLEVYTVVTFLVNLVPLMQPSKIFNIILESKENIEEPAQFLSGVEGEVPLAV